MSRRKKARVFGRSLPLSPDGYLHVTLLATNGRLVYAGPVIEAHHHTWLGLFLGYTQDGVRCHVEVTKEFTRYVVGSPTGEWTTYWHDPDEDKSWG